VKSVQICTPINDLHQTHKPHFGIEKGRGFGDFLNPYCKDTCWHNYRQQSATACHYTYRRTLLVLQQYHKIKVWCGNKPLCTKHPYDLGKAEVKTCTEHTNWTYPKIEGPNDTCRGSDHSHIKLQETSSINHTNNKCMVVGF
jgi:hypothetical protein